uniref:Phosphoinositide-3-kinase adaptor protein 1 n=1 Tax=Gasterosteus aculeatus TaxID=69293 RepID=G3NFW8_GASAC
ELLVLHAAEAQEWAAYLQQILKSSKKFRKKSILLYAVDLDDQLHGRDFESLQSCECVVLLLSAAILSMLCDPEVQGALLGLLQPPQRVVVLLCGVREDDVPTEWLQDWPNFRKLYPDDEPALYISTVLQSISDKETREAVQEDEEPAATENSTSEELSEATGLTCLTCLTVQPSRVLCGEREKLFIIFTDKIDDGSVLEVEFSLENISAQRVPGTLENEYTISVTAPDMPAGVISLTMCSDQYSVSLRPVTYYTNMGEVSRYLEAAADPVNFICQAFNLTANATESLDKMLTDSLKSMMPATGLQLFGIRQIEENNMTSYQRNEELPTLLHFAAKYGLKKLTTVLLQCPGALQAYSVMNKSGAYPNTLAEKSGFSDLRQFMDEFVETAAMLKSHIEDSIDKEECVEVYESMVTTSQDIMMKYSGGPEDVYESMLGIDPACAGDLYEVMSAVDENPEEAMLRKFFQAKPHAGVQQEHNHHLKKDIYDTVDDNDIFNLGVLNRPPAPIPRPESMTDLEKPQNYISRVFSDKAQSKTLEREFSAVPPEASPLSPLYDPYAGMKTPGQRQLISLQERVKVGEITVDEAVQDFKSWQFDNERRSSSIRYQQENLKRLRDSITRRHKEREKTGKELDFEISAPLQRNFNWGSNVTLECSVYDPAPRIAAPPPPVPQSIQRSTWKTGSTSSTSSTESNRLSTHSTFSGSGTDPDFESSEFTNITNFFTWARRHNDDLIMVYRIPEKMLHERYISCPTRALPQRPNQRQTNSAPPVPRRLR